jgi:hypothetical protein
MWVSTHTMIPAPSEVALSPGYLTDRFFIIFPKIIDPEVTNKKRFLNTKLL